MISRPHPIKKIKTYLNDRLIKKKLEVVAIKSRTANVPITVEEYHKKLNEILGSQKREEKIKFLKDFERAHFKFSYLRHGDPKYSRNEQLTNNIRSFCMERMHVLINQPIYDRTKEGYEYIEKSPLFKRIEANHKGFKKNVLAEYSKYDPKLHSNIKGRAYYTFPTTVLFEEVENLFNKSTYKYYLHTNIVRKDYLASKEKLTRDMLSIFFDQEKQPLTKAIAIENLLLKNIEQIEKTIKTDYIVKDYKESFENEINRKYSIYFKK